MLDEPRIAASRVFRSLAALAVLAGLGILAAPASGQVEATDQELNNRLLRLAEEIRDLEILQRRIEVERHMILLLDRGTALVSPEQAAGLLLVQTAEGKANGGSIAEHERKVRADTQTFLQNEILPRLKAARQEHQRLTDLLTQDPLDRPSLPTPWTVPVAGGETVWPDPMDWTKVRGSWSGRFWIGCGGEREGVERVGPFVLVLEGNGRVVGTFEEGGFVWPAPGTIEGCRWSGIRCLDDADGWASGEGGGPGGGTYRWNVELGRSGATLTRVNGWFNYDDSAGECTDHDGGDISAGS